MMQVKWTRGLSLAILSAAVLLAASPAAFANCPAGVASCFNSGVVFFRGCGTQNVTPYVWTHHAGLQRIVGADSSGTAKTGGNDSGTYDFVGNQNLLDLSTIGDPYLPGDWLLTCVDNVANGFDGCGIDAVVQETDATCACGIAANCGFRPSNLLMGGVDPAAPFVGRFGIDSVDFDPPFASYNWDDANAPASGAGCIPTAVDGPGPIPCFAIPTPGWASKPTCAGGTCNVTMNLPAMDGSGGSQDIALSIADDCNIAESRAVNCPRNLYQARRLFGRRAACNTTSFDLRTFPQVASVPGTGFTTLTPNWFPLSPQDLNLNGVQDAGETTFTFIDDTGKGPVAKAFTLPVVPLATDCLFIAMGIVVDGSPLAGYEPVVSTVVSVNPNPYQAGTGTPVTDRVYGIRADKAQGQVTIGWSTTGEFSTAGFNVYGGKKSGETKLNSSQIAAKEGTTGNGASYQISVGSGSLKGSTNVFVEVVKTDGTSERFGPASVK